LEFEQVVSTWPLTLAVDIKAFFPALGDNPYERWSDPAGKWVPHFRRIGVGLPQNHDPSTFLATRALRPVDAQLKSCGFVFARYMDDYRIRVADHQEGREALEVVHVACRELGLGLSHQKTAIVPGAASLPTRVRGNSINSENLAREPWKLSGWVRSIAPGEPVGVTTMRTLFESTNGVWERYWLWIAAIRARVPDLEQFACADLAAGSHLAQPAALYLLAHRNSDGVTVATDESSQGERADLFARWIECGRSFDDLFPEVRTTKNPGHLPSY
jgi:hypothetical protein